MALIDPPPSPLVPRLQGVHLFGFDGAPCSQRVAFALAEKGLVRARRVRWNSDAAASLTAAPGSYVFRHVSLVKHDNLTEGYAQIQPNMVVPALVHDGRLYIESMEIIDYLDEAWPGSPLMPVEPDRAALCRELIALGKELHVSVRHVTFNWSLGKLGRTDAATHARLARLEQRDSPEKLAEFYAKFNGNEIEHATFVEHLSALERGYGEQDARLSSDGRPWLTGDTFSTADIIWGIKVLRLTECGYPFAENFPALAAWFGRVRARRGFSEGVMAPHRLMHTAFRIKAGVENLLGRGIRRDSRAAA